MFLLLCTLIASLFFQILVWLTLRRIEHDE